MILARTGDWAQHRAVIRGIRADIVKGHFDSEEPEIWDKTQELDIAGAVAAAAGIDVSQAMG